MRQRRRYRRWGGYHHGGDDCDPQAHDSEEMEAELDRIEGEELAAREREGPPRGPPRAGEEDEEDEATSEREPEPEPRDGMPMLSTRSLIRAIPFGRRAAAQAKLRTG